MFENTTVPRIAVFFCKTQQSFNNKFQTFIINSYRYAREMSNSIAYIVLSSLGVSTVTLVFGGVTFLSVCKFIYYLLQNCY